MDEVATVALVFQGYFMICHSSPNDMFPGAHRQETRYNA